MEKVEFVVVGAGLSGLATALVLAEAGAEVLVVERGDYPGSKNVTGGRLYLGPVRSYLPDLWEEAPLERRVVKERLTMMAPGSSITAELSSERFRNPPFPSYTLLHATFDRWFADQASARGAMVISGYKVDDVLQKDGKVIGIVSSGDEIHADAVVAADGALSFMAEKTGLLKPRAAKNYAVAAKEIIELPPHVIEDRFGVENDEGTAQLFFGSLTAGIHGGGFLYTNQASLSLGLVLAIQDLMDKSGPNLSNEESAFSPHNLLEAFKDRSEIRPLIADGHSVEYSAHIIPEGGFRALPRLFTDGMLIVGDAAGFTLNLGVTVRGMDLALVSGVLAARALLRARERADFSSASLSYYETLIKESFIWEDLKTFQHMPDFLSNPRIYERYPSMACDLLEQILWVGEGTKEKLSTTILRTVRQNLFRISVLRDLFTMRKI
ncbi:MAG: FAD-dependent oxidoreductase [Anaerolineaceae bacterium]|nr:MAG: FAD-dependent oxidoreductase [Anaerolineaceae bacterium]